MTSTCGEADDVGHAGPDGSGIDPTIIQALDLADTDPRQALALVRSAQARGQIGDDPHAQGLAALARGRASRNIGDHHQAGISLGAALELLTGVGDKEATGVAALSLASHMMAVGRFSDARQVLESAEPDLTGTMMVRSIGQRALAEYNLGDLPGAVATWDRMVEVCITLGLAFEEALARQNRGVARVYLGDLDAAEEDLLAAEQLFAGADQQIRRLEVVHNLGFVAARRGDLPKALQMFDSAQEQSSQLGVVRPQALIDRVEVTLDAGLTSEARVLAEAAVEMLDKSGMDGNIPEAYLLAARACEQGGDLDAATGWATAAMDRFDQQLRPRWSLLARYRALRAATCNGPRPSSSAEQMFAIARELRDQSWLAEAIEAEVRGVEVLIENGSYDRSRSILRRLTSDLHRTTTLSRFQVRTAQARLAIACGDAVGARRALVSSLRALRAFQATLGSIELRSRAGGRADELMSLALGFSARTDRPDSALWWIEAIRASQSEGVRSKPDEPQLLALLGSLREVTDRLGNETMRVEEATGLRRRQAALEELVRRRSRHTPGRQTPWSRTGADGLAEALGTTTLIEYAVLDQSLVAVVVQGGESRLVPLGSLAEIRRTVGGLRLTLRVATASEGPDVGGDTPGRHTLAKAGESANAALIEPLGLGAAGDVLIVPVGPLASLPWPALPGLAQTDVTLATSASAWVESRARYRPLDGETRVVVVAGPELHHAEEEAGVIAAIWDGAEVLTGTSATVGAVTSAMGQADLVHIAAHGSHRGDNPLLSGIRLSDGLVTGYELATTRKHTQLIVLSCCDTGMAETGSGIGLAQVLTTTGANAAIASVTPVADQSAVSLMEQLHRRLAGQARPGAALLGARRAVGGPLQIPTTAGFVCFGYG